MAERRVDIAGSSGGHRYNNNWGVSRCTTYGGFIKAHYATPSNIEEAEKFVGLDRCLTVLLMSIVAIERVADALSAVGELEIRAGLIIGAKRVKLLHEHSFLAPEITADHESYDYDLSSGQSSTVVRATTVEELRSSESQLRIFRDLADDLMSVFGFEGVPGIRESQGSLWVASNSHPSLCKWAEANKLLAGDD